MSEAPKKIWAIQGTHHPYWRLKEFPNTVQYIRADIVEEMQRAMVAYMEQFPSVFGAPYKVVDDYKKALKALEEI